MLGAWMPDLERKTLSHWQKFIYLKCPHPHTPKTKGLPCRVLVNNVFFWIGCMLHVYVFLNIYWLSYAHYRDIYACGSICFLSFFHIWTSSPYTSRGRAWLLQDLYSDDRRVWNALFEMVSLDFAAAERDGIASHQGTFWPIILANKGDWSYLATHLNYMQ